MKKESYDKFELSESKENRLWKDSIIVFDTSALIDFYYYPKETRQEIFDKIFKKLKERIWVPYHVQFEYLKNRQNRIEKPIIDKYEPLKKEKIKELKSATSKISKISEQIKSDTVKSESHPYLPQEKIDDFIEFVKGLSKKVEVFEKDLNEEIEKQVFEIKALKSDDTILRAFEENIMVGDELPFNEIMEIVKEGKLRYEFKIPPGYMDLKDKVGTQIFGDLIIWKEILSYSKKNNKSVIFICNDLKIDWCYKDSRNRIKSPREELIKEFYDNNNKEFWMYNQSQFLYKAKEHLKIELEDSKIEEVSRVIKERNGNELIIKCGYCENESTYDEDELFINFELVGTSSMVGGKESYHRAIEQIGCKGCGFKMQMTYEIYEFPSGVHNNEDICIDEGEIIQEPDYVTRFWDSGNSLNDYPFENVEIDLLRGR